MNKYNDLPDESDEQEKQAGRGRMLDDNDLHRNMPGVMKRASVRRPKPCSNPSDGEGTR